MLSAKDHLGVTRTKSSNHELIRFWSSIQRNFHVWIVEEPLQIRSDPISCAGIVRVDMLERRFNTLVQKLLDGRFRPAMLAENIRVVCAEQNADVLVCNLRLPSELVVGVRIYWTPR